MVHARRTHTLLLAIIVLAIVLVLVIIFYPSSSVNEKTNDAAVDPDATILDVSLSPDDDGSYVDLVNGTIAYGSDIGEETTLYDIVFLHSLVLSDPASDENATVMVTEDTTSVTKVSAQSLAIGGAGKDANCKNVATGVSADEIVLRDNVNLDVADPETVLCITTQSGTRTTLRFLETFDRFAVTIDD